MEAAGEPLTSKAYDVFQASTSTNEVGKSAGPEVVEMESYQDNNITLIEDLQRENMELRLENEKFNHVVKIKEQQICSLKREYAQIKRKYARCRQQFKSWKTVATMLKQRQLLNAECNKFLLVSKRDEIKNGLKYLIDNQCVKKL